MNKFITKAGLALLMCILGCSIASAQTTIKGMVTDKNGAPLPGVKVAVRKGSDAAVTDLDGKFTLNLHKTAKPGKKLVFRYGGYNMEKLKIRGNDLLVEDADVKMRRTNAWNRMPGRKGNWLLGVESVMISPSSLPSMGLMVGWCKRVGLYAKLGFPLQPDASQEYGDYGYWYEPEYWWATDKSYASGGFLSAGCMVRLGCALHLYAGAGSIGIREIYSIAGGKQIGRLNESPLNAFSYELGLMTKFRHFYVHAGTIQAKNSTMINIGAGVCF